MPQAREVWLGRRELGATWDGRGTNFALFSEHATRVDLCLYQDVRGGELERVPLPEVDQHVWHGYLPGVGPGQLYGYRVHGPHAPLEGHRFNSTKLLIDPYARAIAGDVDWSAAVHGYRPGSARQDLARDSHDSGRGIPKSVVVAPSFDWQGDRSPGIELSDSVIYEVHVKGMTARHPDVPPYLRGTYAGLASQPVLEHLRWLGVTAVELLPVHHFVDEQFLLDRGLRNYWGYNSVGYFAPAARYSSSGDRGQQVNEFKAMVRAFHAAGIEIILDVVYNHTAEGNHLGPTLSFRGIDNAVYYTLVPDQPRFYQNFSGTGNSLNLSAPGVLQLVADSLRYWVQEMHVDGFRFDLAVALGRDPHTYERTAGFFDVLHQDPVLAHTKLIAEPWDVGEGGYQVGNFPVRWSEWNGKYRDNVRRFWRGDAGQIADLGYHLSGSSYLYRASGRKPSASINFVTAHDGFTLRDLVSFNEKHNEANGENNADGTTEDLSWNCGEEGPSTNPDVENPRARQQRNFLATLLLSQGVPMLLGGDEMGRTQKGNNNAYCQDNEVSWIDWTPTPEGQALQAFCQRLLRLRREHPILRRRRFFQGLCPPGCDIKDLTWVKAEGGEMEMEDWADAERRAVGMRLAGDAMTETGEQGWPIRDETLLLLFSAHPAELPFVLPPSGGSAIGWQLLLDTRDDALGLGDRIRPAGASPGVTVPEGGGSLRILPSGQTVTNVMKTVHPVGAVYTLAERGVALFRRAP